MKAVINSQEEKVQIDYIESCVPPMQSGEYQISVTQKIDAIGYQAVQTQNIRIEGPRFSLAEADVESVYPPVGMKGKFRTTLPHIVFQRRTLPWERTPIKQVTMLANEAGTPPRFKTPWMALLLLCGNEIEEIKSDPVSKVYPETDVLNKKEICHYIDLDKDLFLRIMPTPSELTFLCHTRRVNITAQSVGDDPLTDMHSVLIGNRLPVNDVKSRAYVVSLEGYINHEVHENNERCIGNGNIPEMVKCFGEDKYVIEGATARLTVLYSWDFYSSDSDVHIKDLFDKLDINSLTYSKTVKNESTNAILSHGFVPVQHKLREGSQTVSFYRGPFTPNIIENAGYSFDSADSLYKYDPEIGMFDVSYAAAWQEGRLLTMNSKAIAVKIMRSRTNNLRMLAGICANRQLESRLKTRGEDMDKLSFGKEGVHNTVARKAGHALLDFFNQKDTDRFFW